MYLLSYKEINGHVSLEYCVGSIKEVWNFELISGKFILASHSVRYDLGNGRHHTNYIFVKNQFQEYPTIPHHVVMDLERQCQQSITNAVNRLRKA